MDLEQRMAGPGMRRYDSDWGANPETSYQKVPRTWLRPRSIWRFPEIGVRLNHPFYYDFHHKPAILGYPHDYGNPHIRASWADETPISIPSTSSCAERVR